MELCYKIIELGKNGEYKTLFHGVDGSRVLSPNIWYNAIEKPVTDGGAESTQYLSGFHVMRTEAECLQYLKRFKNRSNKKIVKCECEDLRKKAHSPSNVWLTSKMRILSETY